MDPRFPTGKFTFVPNPTRETRRDGIAAISSFPGELKAAMAGARLDQPYRDGGWTARQVVHHIRRTFVDPGLWRRSNGSVRLSAPANRSRIM